MLRTAKKQHDCNGATCTRVLATSKPVCIYPRHATSADTALIIILGIVITNAVQAHEANYASARRAAQKLSFEEFEKLPASARRDPEAQMGVTVRVCAGARERGRHRTRHELLQERSSDLYNAVRRSLIE